MTLFDECIEALGNNAVLLSEEESRNVFQQFQAKYPLNSFLKIKWEDYDNKRIFKHSNEIITEVKEDISVYIIWDNARLPVLESDLGSVLQVIDDVTAVSFDTWIYNPEKNFLIEFHHDGKITMIR